MNFLDIYMKFVKCFIVRNRAEYFKEYREKFGDVMRSQVKEWFKKHPDYSKKWRRSHPDYFKDWQKHHPNYCMKWRLCHKAHWKDYIKNYMRKYRAKSCK